MQHPRWTRRARTGIEFIHDNDAWGFVRVEPDHAPIYVADAESEIRYIAEVAEVVPAREAELAEPSEEDTDRAEFDPNEKVVSFEPDSLYGFEETIPFEIPTGASLHDARADRKPRRPPTTYSEGSEPIFPGYSPKRT